MLWDLYFSHGWEGYVVGGFLASPFYPKYWEPERSQVGFEIDDLEKSDIFSLLGSPLPYYVPWLYLIEACFCVAASTDKYFFFISSQEKEVFFNSLNYLLKEFVKMNFVRGMLEILKLFMTLPSAFVEKAASYGTFGAVFHKGNHATLWKTVVVVFPQCQLLQRLKHHKNAWFGKCIEYNSYNCCKKSDLCSNTFKHS